MRGSRIFARGGGGGPGPTAGKLLSDVVFFFEGGGGLVLNLFNSFTEGGQWLFKKIYIIFQSFRGRQTFSRCGVQLFQGSKCYFL